MLTDAGALLISLVVRPPGAPSRAAGNVTFGLAAHGDPLRAGERRHWRRGTTTTPARVEQHDAERRHDAHLQHGRRRQGASQGQPGWAAIPVTCLDGRDVVREWNWTTPSTTLTAGSVALTWRGPPAAAGRGRRQPAGDRLHLRARAHQPADYRDRGCSAQSDQLRTFADRQDATEQLTGRVAVRPGADGFYNPVRRSGPPNRSVPWARPALGRGDVRHSPGH